MSKPKIELEPGFIMVHKHNGKNRAIEYLGDKEYIIVYTEDITHIIDKEKILVCLN